MHLLVISREETDVEEALFTSSTELQHYEFIRVEEIEINSDIQAYLRSSLASSSFQKGSQDLKVEVEQTLSNRAQGS